MTAVKQLPATFIAPDYDWRNGQVAAQQVDEKRDLFGIWRREHQYLVDAEYHCASFGPNA